MAHQEFGECESIKSLRICCMHCAVLARKYHAPTWTNTSVASLNFVIITDIVFGYNQQECYSLFYSTGKQHPLAGI